MRDSFGARATLRVGEQSFQVARILALEERGVGPVSRLPRSIKVLIEGLLRQEDGRLVEARHIETASRWTPRGTSGDDVPFLPTRVLLQDFTGVPVVADLAAMRDAAEALGADPSRINPVIRADLVVDHSVQVDHFASRDAFSLNATLEYSRNRERYAFLRWGQRAFKNFRVVPPGNGICHQINLEHLATVVESRDGWALCDTVVGADSHTTMINGLGVLGWGVGGIEAEAAMLGQPMAMTLPEVIGVRVRGRLAEGATATDVVLAVTEMLRARSVVGKFVEFCGAGLGALSLPDRATIANMAPEYGATVGFFPVDDETLAYLRLTGRSDDQVRLVEAYCKEQGLFRERDDPLFSDLLDLDLASIQPSLAGPKRPQDRVALGAVRDSFLRALTAPTAQRGFSLLAHAVSRRAEVAVGGARAQLGHGSVVIAAITSCTNTSNPSVMLAAGLLAQKAAARGLSVSPHVKTSLAPGSRVVVDYLEAAGLLDPLERVGFHLVGYGCTTCIGNSGPLPEPVAQAIGQNDLVAVAVLSGNRNFEGRIHPLVRAAYLGSPPLVVAYALCGRVDIDLTREPVGCGADGRDVFLREIWPSAEEVRDAARRAVRPEAFRDRYAHVFEGDSRWTALAVPEGDRYAWQAESTYIRRPPFVEGLAAEPDAPGDIEGARVLALLGDSVTTDHISPAGSIASDGPAGQYLASHGVSSADFNSFGARRGNHEVMLRGTFANPRIKNLILPGVEGGVTVHHPTGRRLSIYDAAMAYAGDATPLIVIAGKEYGTGSSRDWAAKGTRLLGVRAVMAESYERIHRSNLVGMGVLPLEFRPGESAASLGLDGTEVYDVLGIARGFSPRQSVQVRARRASTTVEFQAVARLDTPVETEYFAHGGILPAVLRQLARE